MKIDRPFKNTPDFDHFRKVLLRETTDGPVPIVELLVDLEVMEEATGLQSPIESWMDFANMTEEMGPGELEAGIQLMDLTIAFHQAVGYDYVTMTPIVPLKQTAWNRKENPRQGGKVRGWQEEHRGLITTREELEAYTWPTGEEISILPVDYTADKIPPGMKQMNFCNGIFEELRNLMGFETMAIKSIEEPDLLVDILENLAVLTEPGHRYGNGPPERRRRLLRRRHGLQSRHHAAPRFLPRTRAAQAQGFHPCVPQERKALHLPLMWEDRCSPGGSDRRCAHRCPPQLPGQHHAHRGDAQEVQRPYFPFGRGGC